MIFWMVFMRALRRGDWDWGQVSEARIAHLPAGSAYRVGSHGLGVGMAEGRAVSQKQMPAFWTPALAFGGTRFSESSSTRPARNRTPRSTKRERGGEATSPPRQPLSAATAVVPTCQPPPN